MRALVGMGVALSLAVGCTTGAWAQGTERDVTKRSQKLVPVGPWPAGDERGMANAIGPGTWMRCGWYLSQPKAKAYEASHVRSNTMPLSPLSVRWRTKGVKKLGTCASRQTNVPRSARMNHFESAAQAVKVGRALVGQVLSKLS